MLHIIGESIYFGPCYLAHPKYTASDTFIEQLLKTQNDDVRGLSEVLMLPITRVRPIPIFIPIPGTDTRYRYRYEKNRYEIGIGSVWGIFGISVSVSVGAYRYQ